MPIASKMEFSSSVGHFPFARFYARENSRAPCHLLSQFVLPKAGFVPETCQVPAHFGASGHAISLWKKCFSKDAINKFICQIIF